LKGNLKSEPKESCDNFSLPGLETQCKYRRGDRGKNFSEIFLAAAVVMCQIQPARKWRLALRIVFLKATFRPKTGRLGA